MGPTVVRRRAWYSSSVYAGYFDEIVAHFCGLLGDRLVGIVLYGSRARGDAREDSDVDLFLLAEDLPEDLWERARLLHFHSAQPRQPDVAIRALTPAEYARHLSSLDLDIAIDGRVLWDRDGHTASRLALIRQRLDEAGHYRTADLRWRWRESPSTDDWEIDWHGVRV